jgi:hypothetical protein
MRGVTFNKPKKREKKKTERRISARHETCATGVGKTVSILIQSTVFPPVLRRHFQVVNAFYTCQCLIKHRTESESFFLHPLPSIPPSTNLYNIKVSSASR